MSVLLNNLEEPTHEETLFRVLIKDIRQGRDIKTRDAGQTTGRTILLHDVFIDLPIEENYQFTEISEDLEVLSLEAEAEDDSEVDKKSLATPSPAVYEFEIEEDGEDEKTHIVDMISRVCRNKLDSGDYIDEKKFSHKIRARNRIVLLGGGQGKGNEPSDNSLRRYVVLDY